MGFWGFGVLGFWEVFSHSFQLIVTNGAIHCNWLKAVGKNLPKPPKSTY